MGSESDVRSRPRILVTGATGYVGGRLLPALLERGEQVRCLARRPEAIQLQPQLEGVAGGGRRGGSGARPAGGGRPSCSLGSGWGRAMRAPAGGGGGRSKGLTSRT